MAYERLNSSAKYLSMSLVGLDQPSTPKLYDEVGLFNKPSVNRSPFLACIAEVDLSLT